MNSHKIIGQEERKFLYFFKFGASSLSDKVASMDTFTVEKYSPAYKFLSSCTKPLGGMYLRYALVCSRFPIKRKFNQEIPFHAVLWKQWLSVWKGMGHVELITHTELPTSVPLYSPGKADRLPQIFIFKSLFDFIISFYIETYKYV
jgi:hypothetical protein